MKTTVLIVLVGMAVFTAGCGPSQAEREAAERVRLDLEDQARREEAEANRVMTEMNQNMFKKLTPEERAKRDEERKRNAQKLVDEWKEKETRQEAQNAGEAPNP